MSAQKTTVESMLAALEAKDLDGALAYFTDDAVLESPMGPQQGKAKIRGMFDMMTKMPSGGGAPTVVEENGVVIARGKGPMGPVTMTFDFAGDLISRQAVKMG